MHTGSTVGLCPPVANLDDGGTYNASDAQREVWGYWLNFWTLANRTAAGRRVLVLNGDIIEGDAKKRSFQVITRNRATLLKIAIAALKPALDWADDIYCIRGTEAHTGVSAELEESLAYDIGATQEPENKTYSWWHLRVVAGGVKFDIAHHTQMGGLPWTEKAAAIKLAEIIESRYDDLDIPPPDVVVRSHVHRYADSGGNYDFFAVMAPSWTSKTSHLYRIGKENDMVQVGGLLFRCHGGQYQYEKKLDRLKVKPWQV